MSDKIAELAKRIIASGYEYSGGGKIHIKPENRGKFTALKERTGHSATWFKEHGTPSQKKMAVFALNSRHWRHENGGFLHTYNEGYQLGQTYDLSEEEVNELIRQGNESLNAAKWKHGDGGFLHSYDGRSEPSGQMRRAQDITKMEQSPNFVGPAVPDVILKRRAAIDDIQRRIIEEENRKQTQKEWNRRVAEGRPGGWNEAEGRWYPEGSVEGGAKTIAYGIKLSNGSPEAALAKKQGYLTDEQALDALYSLSNSYYDSAKKVYDRRFGTGAWDRLNHKQQSILTDYEYNPGLSGFPKLMDATYAGDIEGMKNESSRNTGGKPLKRNKGMLRDIDSLLTAYPIVKGGGR